VECSPVFHRVSLYEFTAPSDPQDRDACAQLLALASQRAGQVRITKYRSS
jgi:hypothetical protein